MPQRGSSTYEEWSPIYPEKREECARDEVFALIDERIYWRNHECSSNRLVGMGPLHVNKAKEWP